MGEVVRSAVLIASVALTGCFYMDPINQRPSLDINQDVVGPIYRKQTVKFSAVVVDPDDHGVDLEWRAYMCSDATTSTSCDATTEYTAIGAVFELVVPEKRLDGTPVQGMRVVLNGIDDHGAAAKPADTLELPVLDRSPTIDPPIRATSVYAQPSQTFVVGMPIDLFAVYTDGDDALDSLTVDWKVFAPSQVPIDFTDRPIESPAGKRQVHKVLRPQVTGQWSVELTVTDPVGNATKQSVMLSVVDDRAPCIDVAALSPAVPPAGAVRPVYEETLFQVPRVDDDLDSYPRSIGGSEFGTATIEWTVLAPGGTREVVATDSNYDFDPKLYTPGSIVELRVEIKDRKQTPITCADGAATCGPSECLQRQTWRIEAR